MIRKLQLDVLVFDIDGVLIDVSASYRDAICQTVQLYLEEVLGLAPYRGDLVSQEDVAAFKMAGGFNNDWDLTAALIYYFASFLDAPRGVGELPKTPAKILALLRDVGASAKANVADLHVGKNVARFAARVRAAGGGLEAATRLLGARNAHLVFATGDLHGTNLVKRLFEEVYLGTEYFSKEYGEVPLIFNGPGLIRRERLIATPGALDDMGDRAALAVATGRPRNQALYALRTAGTLDRFRSLVTHEDIMRAEEVAKEKTGQRVALSKPHPYALLEAVRRVTPDQVRCAYIGDTLDDVRAANAAKAEMDFVSIGCLAPATEQQIMRAEFERAGADVIVEHPDELARMLGL